VVVGLRKMTVTTTLAAALIVAGLQLAPPAEASAGRLFGYSETPYSDLKPFPKWQRVLDNYLKAPGACTPDKYNRCAYQKWVELIEEWRLLPKAEQLEKVNRHMNLFRYITDPVNWGVKDYWEIPKEFFARFGDCEDYAIVKYFTLRALGWSEADMKIVILQDMNLGVAHAILVVDFDGRQLVLDNQIGQVVEASRIRHYKPIYSVNEAGWWRHKPARAAN